MPDLPLSRVTASGKKVPRPTAASEAEAPVILLPCKCGRVFVTAIGKATVQIKCRDCKARITYKIDGERIVSYQMDKPPKERKRH